MTPPDRALKCDHNWTAPAGIRVFFRVCSKCGVEADAGVIKPKTPPASPAPGARYRIGSDNSGHRYFYPVDKEAEFSAWQELDEDDERSWTEPSFATRIDGRFTFTDPRCE
jgi:hypothetical protein